MAVIRLKATREGSLLNLLIDREISEQQLAAIEIVLSNDTMAHNVVEDARMDKLIAEHYPHMAKVFGISTYEPDTAPRGGIEQYQAEDR